MGSIPMHLRHLAIRHWELAPQCRFQICHSRSVNPAVSTVVRLLEENRASKQFLQLSKLAQIAGYNIEFTLKKRTAA